jgi:hypothetical protein
MTFNAPNATASGTAVGQNLVKKLLMGGGLAAALVLYGYQFASHNAQQTLALVAQFGPSFMLEMTMVLIIGYVLNKGMDNIGRLADSMQGVNAGIERIAEKDDRNIDEMRRLTQFAAQQAERNCETLGMYGTKLDKVIILLEGESKARAAGAGA